MSPFLFRANPYFRKESLRYRCRLAEKKETGYHKDTRDSYTYSNFCSILLSSRLYCRFWNRTKSAAHRGSRTLPPVRNCTSPRRIFFLFGTIIYLLFSDFKLFPEKILFQKTVPHRALFVDMYFADLTAVSDEISVRKRLILSAASNLLQRLPPETSVTFLESFCVSRIKNEGTFLIKHKIFAFTAILFPARR